MTLHIPGKKLRPKFTGATLPVISNNVTLKLLDRGGKQRPDPDAVLITKLGQLPLVWSDQYLLITIFCNRPTCTVHQPRLFLKL